MVISGYTEDSDRDTGSWEVFLSHQEKSQKSVQRRGNYIAAKKD